MWKKQVASINDKAYLTAVYQRYAAALFAYLCRHISSQEDNEDMLLDVFLAAVVRLRFVHKYQVNEIAWSLDGNYIASCEGNTQGEMVAKVWVAK